MSAGKRLTDLKGIMMNRTNCTRLLIALVLFGAVQSATAQQLTDNDKAVMLLASAQRAYNEKQLPFAIERFREFLQKYGGHKDVQHARYGLGVALLELPQRDDKTYLAAMEALQPPAGQQEFSERAFALYYLAMAQRALGHWELAQGIAKPPEMPQRRNNANQRFTQAEPQFAAAATAFASRVKTPPAATDKSLPADLEWAARAKCDQAEMLLQLGKFAEALKAVEPLVGDPIQKKSRYHRLARYNAGYAQFSLKDYPAAVRTLAPLAPFDDPAFGVHTQYLLGRTHHLAEERPEAIALYDAVLAGYEKHKQDAQKSLQNPNQFNDNPDEKVRLEALVKNPPPDYVARSQFFRGVLLFELNKFAEAQTAFATFVQKSPDSPLLKDAQLRLGMTQVQLKQFAEAVKTLAPLEGHAPLADQALWWLGRAQARGADTSNPQNYEAGLKAGIESFRKGAERANQLAGSDPQAKARRGEILIDMADAQQLVKQFNEAAATYSTVINEKHHPQRVEESLERQTTALHLAGKFKESDDACVKFQQTYPQSVLLPMVLFRMAENAYLVATTAANKPDLPNREQELPKLFGEAIKRYRPLIEKYPEFEYVQIARNGLASSHYQLAQFEEAIPVLEAIPEPDRVGKLVTVPYLLADCLARLFPPDADDALSAARLTQDVEKAIKLLDGFLAAEPKSADAPDALLKLGYCHQRMAGLTADPQEKGKILQTARQTYEKLPQQFGSHALIPTAYFERAKCIAESGDVNGAINELNRFQGEFKAAPIAPLALLRLSSLLRSQNKPADAEKVLAACRAAHEGAMQNDPARVAWVPLVQYHQGLALKEQNKLPEARAIFEGIAKQFANRPEAPEAAWRAGQCRREEALAKRQAAQLIIAKPDAKPDEVKTAQAAEQDSLKLLRETGQYFEQQAQQLATKSAGSEAHLRMLYDGAWSYRTVADAEIELARKQMQADAVKKRQDELAKLAKPGEPVPTVYPPEIAAAAIPIQPAEQKSRDLYKGLIAAGPDKPLSLHARLELGELHARRDEQKEAVALLNEAIDKDPPAELADRLRLRLGSCYLAQKDFPNAIGQFEAVLSNEKSLAAPEARYRAGEVHLQQEDWAGAIQKLQPFRDLQPLHNLPGVSDRAVLRLGHAFAHAGQWDQSRQTLELFTQRYGNSVWLDEARYGIAWAWQNQKQFDQAVNTYSQVTNRTAAEVAAKAQLQIGLCRLEQKRPAEAASALLVVPFTYDYPEWSAVALCEASRAFVDMKQPSQAGKLLERVVKDYPQSQWTEVAKKRLREIK